MILMLTEGLREWLNPKDEYFDYDRTKALFAEAASGHARGDLRGVVEGR